MTVCMAGAGKEPRCKLSISGGEGIVSFVLLLCNEMEW